MADIATLTAQMDWSLIDETRYTESARSSVNARTRGREVEEAALTNLPSVCNCVCGCRVTSNAPGSPRREIKSNLLTRQTLLPLRIFLMDSINDEEYSNNTYIIFL